MVDLEAIDVRMAVGVASGNGRYPVSGRTAAALKRTNMRITYRRGLEEDGHASKVTAAALRRRKMPVNMWSRV
jgi:hypothetical protein